MAGTTPPPRPDTGDPTKQAKPGHVPGFCARESRRYLLVAAILASALGFIDGTLVAIALPAIRETLGAGLAQAQWINNGYLLPLSALILLGGALGDRYGQARVFAIGIAVFVLASLGCAVAPTPAALIAARVVQGVGAAAMIPGSLALIARAYPREERGRAIGIWAAASAVTTALGPLGGGAALSLAGPEIWRWLFAINLPLGALAIWLILRHVARDHASGGPRLDWPGAALITLALGALAWGLTEASEGGEVHLPRVAVGAALFAGFVAWEARSPHPMVPLSLFRDRGFAAANVATGLIYFTLSAIFFFLPMTLVAGWGLDEARVAMAFVPMSILIPIMSTTAGKLADRHGAGPLIGAGGAVVAVAYLAMALVAPSRMFWTGLLPASVLMAFGMSLLVAPLSTAIMAAVEEARSGLASGINNAVTRTASLLAVAAMGVVASSAYLASGGNASFGEIAPTLPGHAEAIDRGFQAVAMVSAVLTAAGAAVAWLFIPRPALAVSRGK